MKKFTVCLNHLSPDEQEYCVRVEYDADGIAALTDDFGNIFCLQDFNPTDQDLILKHHVLNLLADQQERARIVDEFEYLNIHDLRRYV